MVQKKNCPRGNVQREMCGSHNANQTGHRADQLTAALSVNECQVNFGFLPAKSLILIRPASFLQKFIA